MEALILIGGAGSRIKSIENEKPKCLINVSNKPFIRPEEHTSELQSPE